MYSMECGLEVLDPTVRPRISEVTDDEAASDELRRPTQSFSQHEHLDNKIHSWKKVPVANEWNSRSRG